MADAKSLQHPDAAPVPPSSPTQDQSHQAQPSIEASSNPTTKRIFAPSPKQDSPLAPKTRFSQPTVQAADTIDVFSDSYPLRQSRYTIPQGMSKAGRNPYRQSTDKDKGIPEFDTITEDYDNPQILSEDYDLYPRIMHDVQHVLKLKARREARKFAGKTPPRKGVATAYDVASGSSLSDNSSPQRITFPPAILPSHGPDFKVEAEVDFSPSTTQAMSVPLHPVPTLSVDGKLLDWTGAPPDDEKFERRWTLSVSKRKEKEKMPIPQPGSVAMQESLYAKKIAKIKSRANSQTLRKVAITADQLRRRYNILYGSLTTGSTPLNLASIARWNGGLEGLLRTSFEKTEPFTWLKHLDKPGTKPSTRLMWHLNALIVEEYCHALAIQPKAEHSDDSHSIDPRPGLARMQATELSSLRSPNRVSLRYSLDPTLSRKLSLEDQVSFEPRAESIRESHEGDSRRSIEGFRGLKYWSPSQNDSGRNSINSVLSAASQPIPVASYPTNSRLHVRGDSTRNARHRTTNGSDDALSSARGSVSDISEIDGKGTRSPKRPFLQLELESQADLAAGIKFVISGDPPVLDSGEVAGTASPLSGKAKGSDVLSDSDPSVPTRLNRRRSHSHSIEDSHRVFDRRRRVRTSVHSPNRTRLRPRQEVEDDILYREYEFKAQLLDDAVTHNHAIRQLLHRIAEGVREYEKIRATLEKLLGVQYKKMPQDLLDSFSHDPSAVTGATRKLRGWRAVEDIHDRLLQQRDTFQRFISIARRIDICESVLHDPIDSVLQALQALDGHQQEIANKAADVTDTLAQLKVVHAAVKQQYNETLSHTSVQYPELSHIEILEESYRDPYQQFWELGLDALTFLLDTVTPFWRNYGRIIGKDIQDFLIVPLYRNEFTGEAKRYPIQRIPRRSIRHWIGLQLLFVLSVTVTSLQARAAVTSIMHFRLRGITHNGLRYLILPFFWISIIIQWAAVFTELAIVVTQLGVVIWWIGWMVKMLD